MKRILAIADRAAFASLKLLAAVNLLFLGSLVAMMGLATVRAGAEVPACTGNDVAAALERNDPKAMAAIRAEASRVPNGKGLLWKIEKNGRASFLFGTMHMTDPRVTSLPPAARKAFDAASTLVIETTDVLDKTGMMAALLRKPELTMFTDGTTLTSLLPHGEIDEVNKALDQRGI